jgi:hypothetical protein
MIPTLVDLNKSVPWPVLPPGIHDATLAELAARFALTPHRRKLLDGFERVALALAEAGCRTAYIDGSFTTGKPHPDDFDGCWEHEGVNLALLDPVLKIFAHKRAAQKRKYLGEMFPAALEDEPGVTFLALFQIEKFSGLPKGILRVSLEPEKGVI